MVTIACRDMGFDCDYVAKGEDMDAAMSDLKEHGMSVHNLAEADMTPEMADKMRQMAKEE